MACSRFLFLAPLLVACSDDPKGDTGTSGTAASVDADGDGYDADEDCNDADAAIHPGAAEVCDGIDNDCDDLVDDADDSVEGQSTWYTDADGDGFGDPEGASLNCEAPSGTVTNDTDCDDSTEAVSPDASEICDGIDNDCDTLVDTDDDSLDRSTLGTYYSDNDGDGYGDPDSPVEACEPPTGTVSDDTDCDDSATGTNPGATEIEGDRLDNDCDLTTLDNPNGGVFDQTVATTHITGVTAYGGVGNDIVVGDFNGDGSADVATGSQLSTVFMHHGPHTTSETTDEADAALTGVEFSTYSYTALASADIDGDGYDDIAAGGRSTYGRRGGAFIQYGPFTGTTDLSTSADATVQGSDSDDYLGAEVGLVADLTGDGAIDWLVGAPYDDARNTMAGAAYIFSDTPTGTINLADADAVVYATARLQGYGADVASTDVNGDGAPDLIATSHLTLGDNGTIYVHYGPISGEYTTGDADLQITTTEPGHGELTKAVGDIDGDGYQDFGSGAWYSDVGGFNAGAVYFFSGSASPTATTTDDASASIVGSAAEYVGRGLAGIGDYDFDGTDDIIAGAYYGRSPTRSGGSVYVFTGPLSGRYSTSDAFVTIHGSTGATYLSAGLAPTPDMDGDGRPELWVGGAGLSDTASTQGRIFLFESLNL